MAFGLTYNGGEDFLPIVKYDARAGRISRRDRGEGGSTDVDITRSFKAVFDFENLEVGWISFPAGGAPSFSMAKVGDPMPPKPSDNHRQGVRIQVKLGKDCGGDVRELASNAGAFLRGTDKLHDQYLAEVKNNPGKLPVVVLSDSVAETVGKGDKKSTNYVPVWQIVQWVPRPAELVYKPRSAAPEAAPSTAPRQESFGYTPPSTGSTHAAPPAAPAPAPQPVAAEEDFG